MNKDHEEQNLESALEAFLSSLSNIKRQESTKAINFERYKHMLQATENLKNLLADTNEETEVCIEIDKMFNSGTISCELTDLTSSNTLEFSSIISKADNFKIYPLVNGNLQLNITFYNILKKIERKA